MTTFSRRKALKTFGILAGTAAITQVPSALKAAAAPLAGFDAVAHLASINTAVLIGAGMHGQHIAKRLHLTAPHIRLTAVAEKLHLHRKAISQAQQLSDQQFFADWRPLLENPEPLGRVAILCTAQQDCPAAARKALQAGYDVWINRRLSLDKVEEADLVALAKRQGQQLMYCYVQDGVFKILPYKVFQPAKAPEQIG